MQILEATENIIMELKSYLGIQTLTEKSELIIIFMLHISQLWISNSQSTSTKACPLVTSPGSIKDPQSAIL